MVPSFVEPELRENEVRGEVMYIDGFGNLITNISEGLLAELGILDGSELSVEVGGRALRLKLRSAYGEARPGELMAIIDSWGMLELAVNLGSAAEALGARPGDKVVVRPAGRS